MLQSSTVRQSRIYPTYVTTWRFFIGDVANLGFPTVGAFPTYVDLVRMGHRRAVDKGAGFELEAQKRRSDPAQRMLRDPVFLAR